MDKQIVFEDEHIRVIFLTGSSDTLVISFGGWCFKKYAETKQVEF